MLSCFCKSLRRGVASQESVMLFWLSTALFTASCKLCAIQPKLASPHSSISLIILHALSLTTTCTLSFVILHCSNMVSKAWHTIAPVCDLEHFCACSRTFCILKYSSNHWAIKLSILTAGLMSDVQMSVVKLMCSPFLSIKFWMCVVTKLYKAGREHQRRSGGLEGCNVAPNALLTREISDPLPRKKVGHQRL